MDAGFTTRSRRPAGKTQALNSERLTPISRSVAVFMGSKWWCGGTSATGVLKSLMAKRVELSATWRISRWAAGISADGASGVARAPAGGVVVVDSVFMVEFRFLQIRDELKKAPQQALLKFS